MSQTIDPAFIRALKVDYLGEVSTEVNFRLQSYLTFNAEVAKKALEFAELEASTRDMIGKELAKYGVRMGKCLWLKTISFILLIPIKLVLPTKLWVHLIYRSTLHALKLYESQQEKWGSINPEFFARLVDHEVKQRDWARDYLGIKK
ncbi:MAG: hypothetical protein HY819_18715 [Acidobacteria bacterium]|nr:hypothetical protein [Acidobacteriota bacterium]